MRIAALITGLLLLAAASGLGMPMAVLRTAATRHDAIATATTRRLRRAGLSVTPTVWRTRQLVALALLVICLVAFGSNLLDACLAAGSMVRAASWLALVACRRRHRRRCDAIAVPLAREIAAPMRAGVSLRDAVLAAASATSGDRLLAAVLAGAARRIRLGATPQAALRLSLDRSLAGAPAAAELGTFLEIVALGATSEAVVGGRLAAFADRIEADTQARRRAAASVAEPRFVAVAVPVVGLGLGALMCGVVPHAAEVFASPLGSMVCAAGAGVVALGLIAVFRLTALT